MMQVALYLLNNLNLASKNLPTKKTLGSDGSTDEFHQTLKKGTTKSTSQTPPEKLKRREYFLDIQPTALKEKSTNKYYS